MRRQPRCVVGLFLLLPGLAAVTLSPASGWADDTAFLDELGRRSYRFFREQTDPATGLVADRARADGSNNFPVASIASTGFGLAGLCIAEHRGWVTRAEAYGRALTTLRYLADQLPHERGFYYHFVDKHTGQRAGHCELSSIDTALLLAGVLTVRQYFRGTEVERLATRIYQRVDWPWMLAGGQTLSMGWTPEQGFLNPRWDGYSEHMLLYLLGLGSPTHPLPPSAWHAWQRTPQITYGGRTFLQCQPLFTHQYSQAFVDFRNRRDAHADYWRNSVLATLAQREWCATDLRDRFPHYSTEIWGITSSDGADGYQAWGGPPATAHPPLDGSVVPCAPGGSIPFAPRECLAALRAMHDRFGDRIWQRYGFVDAFNPHTGWVNRDVIGIDVGITLVMLENERSGLVWKYFMRNPEIQRALNLAGFQDTTPQLSLVDRRYLRRLARDTWRGIERMIDRASGLPHDNWQREEFTSVSNIGLYLTDLVVARDLGLVSPRAAERRAVRVLDSLDRFPTVHGFRQSWHSVTTFQPATHDPWISILDSANLAGGLLTAGQAFPRLRERCRALVTAMDWRAFYRPADNVLLGGYDTVSKRFNPDWTLPLLGADSRLAAFLAVASGRVPPRLWEGLDRGLEQREHASYLVPGWDGGGLFMQYITGLWLDERGTIAGQSAQNFAFAQIAHAVRNGYPAWGWSASDSPAGQYLGWGALDDDIVTPHASALALQDFPPAVVANLRALELLGARHPRYGFYDAINWRTGAVAKNFLLLDQSMLLISLANHLEDNLVRRYFQADPIVQRGRDLITDYRAPAHGPQVSVFTLGNPRPPDLRAAPQRVAVARRFDGWRDPVETVLGKSRFAFAWDDTALHVRVRVTDSRVRNDRPADKLYEQDSLELFIDPQNDGLRWGDAADFQFGFAVTDKTWEWFGTRHDKITATTRPTTTGYLVTATIPWTVLGIIPAPGTVLQVCPAIHDPDRDPGQPKREWNWQPEGDRVRLGKLKLE